MEVTHGVYEAGPSKAAVVRALFAPWALVLNRRQLLWSATVSDVRARYAGSVLGLGWLVVYPLLLLGAYAGVYLYIFKVRFALFDSNEYVAVIFCGLIPFFCFAECLGAGVPSVTANSKLVKNTLFPIELIPVKAVLASQCTQLIGMALLVVALACLGKLSAWCWLALPVWLCQIHFQIGLCWLLSSMNVFLRDLQHIVSILVLVLMMISPIAYTEDMVPAGLTPLLAVNPLYYLIIAYRDCLMFDRIPGLPTWLALVGMAVVSMYGGHFFFTRLKSVFSDNI